MTADRPPYDAGFLSLPADVQAEAEQAAAVGPCRCHQSHAYINPIHGGHCCFLPASRICHPDEFAAWKAEDARWNGRSTQ